MADGVKSEVSNVPSQVEPQTSSHWGFLKGLKERVTHFGGRHTEERQSGGLTAKPLPDLSNKPAQPDQSVAAKSSQEKELVKQPEERFKDKGAISGALSRSTWPGLVAERLSLADTTDACDSLSLPYAQVAEGIVINFGIEPRVAGKPERRYVVNAQGRLIRTDSVYTEDYIDDHFQKHQMKGKILRTEFEYDERGLAVGRTEATVDSNGQPDVLRRDHYVYREGRPLEEYDIEHEAKNKNGGIDRYTTTYETRLAHAKGSLVDH